jgi:expansin (peptidoglycan-binding protein)
VASHSKRRRPRDRRTVLVSAAVAAVALVVSLVMAFRPDSGGDDAKGESTAVAASSESPSRSASPDPTPSKASKPPKPATSKPSATATKAKPKPSASSGSQPASSVGNLAGRIRPKATYSGIATFYDAGNGGDGACSYGPTGDVMTAAMNHTDYETSKACGAYVLVRAGGGATVTVRITNECPLPCAPGQLDLSAEAFAKLAAPSRGEIPITWSLLSPSTSDTVSIRYKTGSSRYWCEIQAIGHRNPLARLEVRTGSGWTRLPRTEYNYFTSEQGGGCGGSIRITDIYGEQLTVDGIGLRPDVVQSTRVQFAKH